MTRHNDDEPCDVPHKTCKEDLLERSIDARNRAREIEELTHQLAQGLIGGSDIKSDGSPEDDKAPMDLYNRLIDSFEDAERSHRVTVERLNKLIGELCS
jgi:hypothetical protein